MSQEEIQLRSEEVQDILTKMPHWTIRYGNFIMLLVSFALIGLSYYIKYPEVKQIPFEISQESNTIIAEATLTKAAYALKVNQKVTLQLMGFPSEEYGFINGSIKAVTNTKSNETTIKIDLGNRLQTSKGINIDYSENMFGTAKLMLNDTRLIERIFDKFQKTIKNKVPVNPTPTEETLSK